MDWLDRRPRPPSRHAATQARPSNCAPLRGRRAPGKLKKVLRLAASAEGWALWALGRWPALLYSHRGHSSAGEAFAPTLLAEPPLGAPRRCVRALRRSSHLPTGLWGIQKGKADEVRRKPGSRRARSATSRASAPDPVTRYLDCPETRAVGRSPRRHDSYLVDSASSHMLVSKIKPCMSKYKQLYSETANGSLNQLSFI